MARSGSFSRNVNDHWRVRCTWEASQNVGGNYSDVTLRVYWESTDSYGSTYTSASKSGDATINGNTSGFTFSARLSGRDSKLIKTHTVRVSHNSDGSKSISLSANVGIELTLSGTYYGNISVSDTVTLDTIPRESKMTSSASFTAGSDRSITIQRFSSKFRHEVELYVGNRSADTWNHIKQVAFGAGDTSENTSFSTAEKKAIFTEMNGASSKDTMMILQTYNGDDFIGSIYYYGTVSAPKATTVNSVNGQVGANERDVWIDQTTIGVGLQRHDSEFDHKVIFTVGSFKKEFNGVGTGVDWTPTTTERNSIYAQMPNDTSMDGNIEVQTFYQGVQVRSGTDNDINFYVRNSNPSMSTSAVTYADTNTTTSTLTGSNQQIVQGKSTVRVTIGSAPTIRNGATFSNYVITLGGTEKTLKTTTGYVDIGVVNGANNQNISVKVVDSRGLSQTVTKAVTMVPYTAPTMTATATRANSFGETVTLRTKGTISSVNSKNTLKLLQYRYKEQGATSYIRDWTNIANTKTGTSFTGNNITMTMDVTKLYTVEVKVSDALTANYVITVDVGAGQPIFYIDKNLRSIGFNDLPVGENEFRVNGRVVFGSNMWANDDYAEGTAMGALHMNNSDITGANGIYFSDVGNNSGEGLMFLKSGKTSGSSNPLDYDQMYLRDGVLEVNRSKVIEFHPREQYGTGVSIGGGGMTAIGAGESISYFITDTTDDWGTEHLHMLADQNVYVHTGVNGGYAGRKTFTYGADGQFTVPAQLNASNGIELRGGRINATQIGGTNHQAMNATAGKVYVGNPTVELYLESNGETLSLAKDGSGARVQSAALYSRQYTNDPNVYVTSYGTLGRATSKRANKLEIEDAFEGKEADWAERILSITPRSWYDKTSTELLSDYLTQKDQGLEPDLDEMEVPYLERVYGVVAEEVEDAGLSEFVEYGLPDENGVRHVEGVAYARLWTLLIPVVRTLRDKVTDLEQRIAALESTGNL
jgi:hypothetical protein